MSNPDEIVDDYWFPDYLRDPLGMLRRRWPWMLAALAIGLVAAGYAALTRPTVYVAKASVAFADLGISEDLVRPTVEEDTLEGLDALAAEVLSLRNLERIFEEHDLYPGMRARATAAEIAPLFRSQLTLELQRVLDLRLRSPSGRIMGIEFRAGDPQTAAAVANSVADLFQEAGARIRTERARVTTEFLRRELATGEALLREVEHEISAFRQEYRGELPSDLDSNLQRLEQLRAQSQTLTIQIGEAETRAVMAAVESAGQSPESRLEQVRADLVAELGVNTETHPNVISLRHQVRLLEEQAEQRGGELATSPVAEAVQREITQLRRELAETDAQIWKLDSRISRAPDREEKLAALEQRRGVLQEAHVDILRKVREAEIAEGLELIQEGERIRVLDRATPPTAPAGSSTMILQIGILASLALSVAVGWFFEWFDPVVVSREGVEAAVGIPIIGAIPRIR